MVGLRAVLRPLALSVFVAGAFACGGGSGKTLGAIGAECGAGRDASCASNTCLVIDTGTAYCSQSCRSQTDCPNGFLCAAAAGGKFCQALGAGGVCGSDDDCPAGEKCDAAGAHCYIPVTRGDCGPCTSDLQCGAHGVCHAESSGERYCASACGGGCAAGYTCSNNVCLPSNGSCRGGRPLCAPCAGDLECGGPGDLCVRNLQSQEQFCGTHCATSADCAANFACVDLSGKGAGPLQCVPNSGTCSGYCDVKASDTAGVQRECGLGSTCDLANHACARLTDGSLCAACNDDDDCTKTSSTALCVTNTTAGSPYQGERFCGSDCSKGTCPGAGCSKDSSKCGSQFECVGIGSNGNWPYQCAPVRGSCSAGFGKLGDSCEKGAAGDCISSICAQFGSEKECSAACTVDADCGDARWRCCASAGDSAYDCSKAPAASGGGICAPVGGSFGDDCAPGSPPCQGGLCLNLGTAQLCTQACGSGASCPSGFSCQQGTLQQADGTLGDEVSVCFPDGGGNAGSDCTFGPAACQSHLCLKKDSGNVCTKQCSVTADCPAKWSCELTGEPDGTQIEVCVPPGVTP
jgi:hypothetical protein